MALSGRGSVACGLQNTSCQQEEGGPGWVRSLRAQRSSRERVGGNLFSVGGFAKEECGQDKEVVREAAARTGVRRAGAEAAAETVAARRGTSERRRVR